MSARKNIRGLLVMMAIAITSGCYAQFPAKLKDGLKTYLTPDSTTYLKLNFVSQVWVRNTRNNPGSTVAGQYEKNTTDVGLRRARIVLTGQITDRVFIYVQFGQNNFGYTSPRKTGAFFHDVTSEFAVVKKRFNLGFGLQGWNGLARFSNSSVSTIMMLDPPLFQETTNDINDQFVRHLGVYAKGILGKLEYRVSMSKPFITQTATGPVDPLGKNASFSAMPPKQLFQGYFAYNFLEQEPNAGPANVGTYLGHKRIFNVGAGFAYQSKATWTKVSADTAYHNMVQWAVDVYYDAPISPRGASLTVYGGYFNYDFGKGYLRNISPMNPVTGVRNGSLNGSGNGAPLIGTGNTGYLQTGYKFRNALLGEYGTLQFYSGIQYSKYDRLADPMILIDTGVNWLIYDHHSKFTFNYQSRPIFGTVDSKVAGRRGEWVLQYQVSF